MRYDLWLCKACGRLWRVCSFVQYYDGCCSVDICAPLSTNVLESLEGMRRILEAVENCALYAVSTAGDARCVLKVVEVVLYILEVVNGVRCVLEVMLCMLFRMLFRMLLEVVLYALEMLEGMRCVLEAQE